MNMVVSGAFALIATTLSACSNQPPTIQRTDVLVRIKLVDRIDYKGRTAGGQAGD
jgi:starvation-inducible outer membrane lipoprotein